jgi:transposase
MPDPTTTTRTCTRCGASAACEEGGLPDGWSVAVERGRRIFHCPSCLKANLMFVEGGIATEWWEG